MDRTEMNSTQLRLTVDRDKIAWLKFLLESYEGLALITTLDAASGKVLLRVGSGAEKDVAVLLEAIGDDIGLIPGLSDDFKSWLESPVPFARESAS